MTFEGWHERRELEIGVDSLKPVNLKHLTHTLNALPRHIQGEDALRVE